MVVYQQVSGQSAAAAGLEGTNSAPRGPLKPIRRGRTILLGIHIADASGRYAGAVAAVTSDATPASKIC